MGPRPPPPSAQEQAEDPQVPLRRGGGDTAPVIRMVELSPATAVNVPRLDEPRAWTPGVTAVPAGSAGACRDAQQPREHDGEREAGEVAGLRGGRAEHAGGLHDHQAQQPDQRDRRGQP